MSHLKRENLKKCFSLLREYVEESTAQGNKKGTAILALNHLQKIYAGGDNPPAEPALGCLGRPILEIS